jgi:hypothetical protein
MSPLSPLLLSVWHFQILYDHATTTKRFSFLAKIFFGERAHDTSSDAISVPFQREIIKRGETSSEY